MDYSKTIISRSPDITVVVGSGDNAQEFRCYSAILASVSPVLDAMLSSGMKESEAKRIEFPDKDPDEWRMLLQIIDSARASLFCLASDLGEGSDREELINRSNVYALVPWFNELQMNAYLNRCDEILLHEYTVKIPEGVKENMKQLLFATKYNLGKMEIVVAARVLRLLEQFCWGFGDPDDFNLSIIQ
jgi:hypothetical protein